MGGNTEDREPRQRLLYLLKRGYSGGKAELDEAVKEYGLTAADFTMLSFVKRMEPCSAADLAKAQRITPQAVTQQVAQLKSKALISSTTSEQNRRIMHITLTPEGKARLAAMSARARALEDHIARGLSEGERQKLVDLLTRVVTAMETKGEEIDGK